ncbi:DMT family transporter [uncultured Microbacterium sp.]|uniref:DMT family transporter n=1 Tax=uncultured Microbacterium sp. TaxID=191216 RepID=UPI0028DC4857|nr:DMT family transporter [uncultured Microbacterium sp.]
MAIGGAVAIGVMTAIQARINGVLGVRLGDGIVAGLVSFSVGTLVLAAIVAALPSGRAGMGRLARGLRARRIPPWMLLGGACGALTVSTQGLTAGLLGVSLFTVGVVAGQTTHGLVLDRIGFGPAGVVAVTMGRVAGAALALIAVAVSLSGDVLTTAPLWMLVLPFAAGVGIAWQQAANGRLAQRVASPMAATMTSFVAGTVVLALAATVSVLVGGAPDPLPAEPWLYLGGTLGVAYIFLGAFLVAHTGVLLLGLGSVLGQLVTAVIIDMLWPTEAGPAPWQIVTMVVIAAASVVVALARPRR